MNKEYYCDCGAETSGSVACDDCWNDLDKAIRNDGKRKERTWNIVCELKRERDAIYQLLLDRTPNDPPNILTAIRKIMDEFKE